MPSLELLEGKLVKASRLAGVSEDARVFYVDQGTKHWVTSAAWISARGLRFPEASRLLPPTISPQFRKARRMSRRFNGALTGPA